MVNQARRLRSTCPDLIIAVRQDYTRAGRIFMRRMAASTVYVAVLRIRVFGTPAIPGNLAAASPVHRTLMRPQKAIGSTALTKLNLLGRGKRAERAGAGLGRIRRSVSYRGAIGCVIRIDVIRSPGELKGIVTFVYYLGSIPLDLLSVFIFPLMKNLNTSFKSVFFTTL
jgi:hypothetical protein